MIQFSYFIFIFVLVFILTDAFNAQASFSNYNSILIGSRAAGMGGAFTALSDDPAACSFYNPATLSEMKGASLSSSVSLFNKYDTQYDKHDNLTSAALRANQGAFEQIPSSTGFFSGFGPFSIGITIVNPNRDNYSGVIKSQDDNTSSLNLNDKVMWFGGALSINLDQKNSIGFSAYYTSRDYFRSYRQESFNLDNKTITEEKSYTTNSIVYILGFLHKLNSNWKLGTSLRLPSIQISGKGSYYRSIISSSSHELINESNISSKSKIPLKLAFGISYSIPFQNAYSFDIHYYQSEKYFDQDFEFSKDLINNRDLINIAFGWEHFMYNWFSLRFGLFTNYSSYKKTTLDQSSRYRTGDFVDMWGFSANMALYTTNYFSLTFGGYYTGGNGESTQFFNEKLVTVPKSEQIFSMLLASSIHF